MKDFRNILRIYKNLMRLSLAMAVFMTLIVLFKFEFISIPQYYEIIEPTVLQKESEVEIFPGEVGSIDVESGLVIDNGFGVVKAQCGSCHSTKLVAQNNLSRQGWTELIRWMQKEQNLWDLGEQESIVLNYLEKNFGPKNNGRRKKLEIDNWYVLIE